MEPFRVFVSAVSREFRQARAAVAGDLRARGLEMKDQDMFRQEGGTLLAKLHDYIARCDAVVCIIGEQSGSFPTPGEAEPHRDKWAEEASYTQWELILGRASGKIVYRYSAEGYAAEESPNAENRPDSQAAFRAWITSLGLDYTPFATKAELQAAVLRQSWPDRRPGIPNNLVYASLGDLFTGRETEVATLHASLSGPGAAVGIGQGAVHGLGGVGKTRLAVEYAHRYAGHYNALLFALADTADSLRSNLARLSDVLDIPGAEALPDAARLEHVLRWFGAHPGWLLILDNVDTPEAMQAVAALMGRLRGGSVVLTSRLSSFPAGLRPLELHALSPEDAAAFLLHRTAGTRRATDADEAEALALAGDLGGLCVALEQAAAYIAAQVPRITFAGYRALLRDSFDDVMTWYDPVVMQYPRAVAATWAASVAQLDPLSLRMLRRLAFLAPDPIPGFLLDVPCPGTTSAEVRAAIAGLRRYSLISAAGDGSDFAVHRLVQDVTRRGSQARADGGTAADPDDPPQPLAEALDWVNAAFVGNPQDYRTWARLVPLAEHAEAVATRAEAAGIDEPTGRLMGALGLLFHTRALYGRAERMSRAALAIAERSRKPDDPELATRLNNLAELLGATNRLAEAEPLYRRALSIDEASLGPDHPSAAIRLNDLAELLGATNRLAEAEPLYRRAMLILLKFEHTTGHTHPNRDTGIANLTIAWHELGHDEAAIMRLLEALAAEARA